MAAVTMATMINKVLMIISSKSDHAELIGNHYFRIGGKIKKKGFRYSLLSIQWIKIYEILLIKKTKQTGLQN